VQSWSGALQHGLRDEQLAAAIVGSPEYAQNVPGAGGSLQQTLLPLGAPTLNVLVVNAPSEPVPVTDGIVRFHMNGNAAFNNGNTVTTVVLQIPVPAGKRLVIENFNGEGGVPAGQHAFFFIGTGFEGQAYFPATFAGSFGPAVGDIFVSQQLVKISFSAGDTVSFVGLRDGTSGSGFANISVDGYFVNVS
jgi:hypothetical protein